MSEPNKFKAFWFSHSSLGDFKKCRRAYYLRNIYKSKNNRKISIVSPYLSLGVAVHDTLEDLAWLPAGDRFNENLIEKFLKLYSQYKGKKGGFVDQDQFEMFQNRGVDMIENVIKNPGPIRKPAVRLIQDKQELAWTWLSKDENIIVSGRTDWLEYDNGKLHVIDFKTGKHQENEDSLQFSFYNIIVKEYKKSYPLTKASYWYLGSDKTPVEKPLPSYKDSLDKLMEECRLAKQARVSDDMKCKYNGCRNCEPLEKILRGEGEYLGVGGFNSEQYYL